MFRHWLAVDCNFCRYTETYGSAGFLAGVRFRRSLRSKGWLSRGPRHVCPVCAAKGVQP
jgi:hypothetical protein